MNYLKALLLKIKLAFIAWFVFGAFFVEVVNYFVYKRSFTPAGVSSTIAALALAFTIYAAFRVKKWSESKVNDKAFIQTDEIISSISEILLLSTELKSQLQLISLQSSTMLVDFSRVRKNIINEKKQRIAQKMMDINLLLLSLKMWKCSTTIEAQTIIDALSKNLQVGQLNITTFNTTIDKPDNEILTLALVNHINISIKQINETLINFQNFFDLGYGNTFIHHEK
ncbi:hypothetical protein ACWXWG_10875 [Pantoea ananatis]